VTRTQAEHVLRAASAIAQETSFVVVGSQAVLFAFADVPADLLVSRELDLYPALHPEKSDLIDGAIGAMSSFDEVFGYHADGVGPTTAVMPADWMTRATLHYLADITVVCPEIHDLALSKCAAGRDKDADFVRSLFSHKLIAKDVLEARVNSLGDVRYPSTALNAWVTRRYQESLAELQDAP
jgi:hypothetical protein